MHLSAPSLFVLKSMLNYIKSLWIYKIFKESILTQQFGIVCTELKFKRYGYVNKKFGIVSAVYL